MGCGFLTKKRRLIMLAPWLALILIVCGNAYGEIKAVKNSPVSSSVLAGGPLKDIQPDPAGVKYYLYRNRFLAPNKTKPSKKRIFTPDYGGRVKDIATAPRSMSDPSLPVTGACRISVSASNLGSRIQPADLSYIGDDFQRLEFSFVRPLVEEIFTVYDNPSTSLGKLRVLRDWIARMAIHPHPPLHPIADKNTHVLPIGWDWAMFDALREGGERWLRDSEFWAGFNLNGYKMLNRLFNLDGTEPYPMMAKIGPAEYRIKKLIEDTGDPEVYRTALCTYQAEMLITLAASIGIHGVLVSTYGHDTCAFYLPEFAKWVYMDPTYNEDFVWASTGNELRPPDQQAGNVASPQELYMASATGMMRDVFLAVKLPGPSWETTVYADSADDSRATYLVDNNAYGWIVMGSNLVQEYADPFRTNLIMFDAPFFYEHPDDPAVIALSTRQRVSDMELVFPSLGVSIAGTTQIDQTSTLITLASNWPYHRHFEMPDAYGVWTTLTGDLVLTVPANKSVLIRSVDKAGFCTQIALMSANCRNAIPAVTSLLLN